MRLKFTIKSVLVLTFAAAVLLKVVPAFSDVVSYWRFQRANAVLQAKAIKVNELAGRETKPDIYTTVYGLGPSNGLLDK